MNIIVCFSWLGNNSLSEKQVLFLLQLHILGLIFGKVRHRALRWAVPGALFLFFQCLLRGIFLDVLCTGWEKDNKGSEWVGMCLATPKSWQGWGGSNLPWTPGGTKMTVIMVTTAKGNPTGRLLWDRVSAFCPLREGILGRATQQAQLAGEYERCSTPRTLQGRGKWEPYAFFLLSPPR